MHRQGFLEIETPMLTKSTPEGARDYLVPSRVHKGTFYALPQSPQIFKQLLMVSGFERYYQIVRCFRDEDLRADRQPEFTQVDIEASFIDEEFVYALIEGLFAEIFPLANIACPTPFPRMRWQEAMDRFGIDRPDMRFGMELADVTTPAKSLEFPPFAGGPTSQALELLGERRVRIAREEKLIPAESWKFLWVVDFPLFEWDEETQRYFARHHPFTSPRLEHVENMESDPGAVLARAYD